MLILPITLLRSYLRRIRRLNYLCYILDASSMFISPCLFYPDTICQKLRSPTHNLSDNFWNNPKRKNVYTVFIQVQIFVVFFCVYYYSFHIILLACMASKMVANLLLSVSKLNINSSFV